jgi:hypothetical protein
VESGRGLEKVSEATVVHSLTLEEDVEKIATSSTEAISGISRREWTERVGSWPSRDECGSEEELVVES